MTNLPARLTTSAPCTWLFYGDSITQGVLHTFGARCFSEHFAERVRFEMNRPDDVVLNTAFSGLNTRQMLTHFSERVARWQPDFVFLMAGMNDCNTNQEEGQYVPLAEFRANLLAMIQAVHGWGGEVLLQTCTPVQSGQAPERGNYLPQYVNVVCELAAEQGILLIDHAHVWQQQSSVQHWYMADAFHPNAYGHILMAHTLFRALQIFDAQAPSCRLFLP